MLREGQKGRDVQVAALRPAALEEERREPVVVLAGRFAVDEGADDGGAALIVAQVPEERKEDVGVVFGAAAVVIERARRATRDRSAACARPRREDRLEAVVAAFLGVAGGDEEPDVLGTRPLALAVGVGANLFLNFGRDLSGFCGSVGSVPPRRMASSLAPDAACVTGSLGSAAGLWLRRPHAAPSHAASEALSEAFPLASEQRHDETEQAQNHPPEERVITFD